MYRFPAFYSHYVCRFGIFVFLSGFLVGSVSSGQSMLGAAELQRYFPERRMTIFVGTWNMGGMRDIPLLMDNFLLPEVVESLQDAYVIGTQEAAPNRYFVHSLLLKTLSAVRCWLLG